MRDGLNAESEVDPEDLFRYVFTEKTSQLREQAAKLRDELAREPA
jgi:pyruvate dehydrogenase E1 component alpha subunit